MLFGFGTKKLQVSLEKPGTLHHHISDDEKYTVSELTIEGELNGTDLLFLRDMAGYSMVHGGSKGCLKRLDLKNARFVPGGEGYARNSQGMCFITEADVIPVRAFRKCENLHVVVLPDNVKRIEPHAFERCTHLSSVSIPEGLETIGLRAFRKCQELKTITFPSTLTGIDKEAFSDDVKIKKVVLNAVTPPEVHLSTFYDVPVFEVKLSVPADSVTTYKKNPAWKKFKKVKAI